MRNNQTQNWIVPSTLCVMAALAIGCGGAGASINTSGGTSATTTTGGTTTTGSTTGTSTTATSGGTSSSTTGTTGSSTTGSTTTSGTTGSTSSGNTGGSVGTTTTTGGSFGTFVEITTDDQYRYVQGNGIPNHTTGNFPNANNPHSISAQNYFFRMDVNPSNQSNPTAIGLGFKPGVAVNSVPYDPLAAEFWQNNQNSGWQYEALGGGINLGVDSSNAHVQPNGAYHYHGMPTGLLQAKNYTTQMALVGWAADGYPIYGPYCYTNANDSTSGLSEMKSSYRIKSGTRPSGPGGTYDGTFVQDYEYVTGLGTLDECNGRTGVTPEFPNGTYYYVLTKDYPFIPRILKGRFDDTFKPPMGGN